MKQKLKPDSLDVAGSLIIRKYRDGELIYESEPMPNKVVSGSGGYGRNIIARALAGDGTYPPQITNASVGDDNTAAADADTDLGNPLVTDIPITNMTVTDDSLQVDVFVADANLPGGTYKEFGLFCVTQFLVHIIISPDYVKATGEDTLFSYTLNLAG